MMAIEKKIVRKILENGIAEGWTFSEGYPEPQFKNSQDVKEILDACNAVDELMLVINKNGKRFASVYLVFGNDGWDVVADNSSSFEPYFQSWIHPIIKDY